MHSRSIHENILIIFYKKKVKKKINCSFIKPKKQKPKKTDYASKSLFSLSYVNIQSEMFETKTEDSGQTVPRKPSNLSFQFF